MFYKLSQSGRGCTGARVIRSKGATLTKFRKTRINYALRYIKLGTIVAFKLLPFSNRLLSLVLFSNGAASFFLTSIKALLFQFWFYNNARITKKLKLIKNLFVFSMLCLIKKLSFVSCVSLTPNRTPQYIRSSGTKAKLIKIDKSTKSALLQLPSKMKKIFSYYSSAFYEQLALPEKKRFTNAKAGYWRLFGGKPIVRGVAMNAVDHPHGGRTKSIANPRTPWGKPTKFK